MLQAPRLHERPDRDVAAQADSTAAAAAAVSSILRAGDLLRGLLASDFSEMGANNARYQALHIIGRSSPHGCSQTELATELDQSESGVSGLVSRMRADGLLYRVPSQHDRRKRMLMLSARGRSLLDECDESRRRQIARSLGRFDFDLLQQLTAQLERLIEGLTHFGRVRETHPADSQRSQLTAQSPEGVCFTHPTGMSQVGRPRESDAADDRKSPPRQSPRGEPERRSA